MPGVSYQLSGHPENLARALIIGQMTSLVNIQITQAMMRTISLSRRTLSVVNWCFGMLGVIQAERNDKKTKERKKIKRKTKQLRQGQGQTYL